MCADFRLIVPLTEEFCPRRAFPLTSILAAFNAIFCECSKPLFSQSKFPPTEVPTGLSIKTIPEKNIAFDFGVVSVDCFSTWICECPSGAIEIASDTYAHEIHLAIRLRPTKKHTASNVAPFAISAVLFVSRFSKRPPSDLDADCVNALRYAASQINHRYVHESQISGGAARTNLAFRSDSQ